jgi:hypothetical protein
VAEAKFVTTAVDQTLTCSIRGLDLRGTPATVSWKDPSGATVIESDTESYTLDQGKINSEGIQSAVLTIKKAKLEAAFLGKGSFTYKCSVKSSLYPDSPAASDLEAVATILTLGMLPRIERATIQLISVDKKMFQICEHLFHILLEGAETVIYILREM